MNEEEKEGVSPSAAMKDSGRKTENQMEAAQRIITDLLMREKSREKMRPTLAGLGIRKSKFPSYNPL